MIRSVIRSQIGKMEKDLGESLDYARFIADTSLGGFMRFAKLRGFTSYRKTLPVDAYYTARIVATRDEDCGPCVQIEVNQAVKDGVSGAVLQPILDADPDALPAELGDVYRFALSVVSADGNDEGLRAVLRERYGDQGLLELSYAIAGPRIFPVLKRALGYAKSCAVHPPRVP